MNFAFWIPLSELEKVLPYNSCFKRHFVQIVKAIYN